MKISPILFISALWARNLIFVSVKHWSFPYRVLVMKETFKYILSPLWEIQMVLPCIYLRQTFLNPQRIMLASHSVYQNCKIQTASPMVFADYPREW